MAHLVWHLQAPTPPQDAAAWHAALRVHLAHTASGLTTTLMQIGTAQRSYLLHAACPGCAQDQCVIGCRWALLRRVLAAHVGESRVSLVQRGLAQRPYTHTLLAWPKRDALPLDAPFLGGWREARLSLRWLMRRGTLHCAAVLRTTNERDPVMVLREHGWQARTLPTLPPGMLRRIGQRPMPAACCRPWAGEPDLLLAAEAQTPRTASTYHQAATIAAHLVAAGGEVEQLDLDASGWTATVAATGEDSATVWNAVRKQGVRVDKGGIVTLDPAEGAPQAPLPLLLDLGTHGKPTLQRYRPIGSAYHLAVAGPDVGRVVASMLAPMLAEQPNVRVGVLDATEEREVALALAALPQRLPNDDVTDGAALMAALGGLASDVPAVVVVHVSTADQCANLAIPLLRAAAYRALGIIVAVPAFDALPPVLRERVPLLHLHDGYAQWQDAPRWADATWLQVPTAAPSAAPCPVPSAGPALLPEAGFWAMPVTLGADETSEERAEAERRASDAAQHLADPSADTGGESVLCAEQPREHTTISTATHRSSAEAEPLANDGAARTMVNAPLHEADRVQQRDDTEASTAPPTPHRTRVYAVSSVQQPPDLGAPPAAERGHARSYTVPEPLSMPEPVAPPPPPDAVDWRTIPPTQQINARLVITPVLLAQALDWAATADQGDGVSVGWFARALGLPIKRHGKQLVEALQDRGLVRRVPRDGWVELRTIEEAVSLGRLPSGPWCNAHALEEATT